jgi:hypothetical protein
MQEHPRTGFGILVEERSKNSRRGKDTLMPGGSGPPDKFPQWVDLTAIAASDLAARAAALGAGYDLFFKTYGTWPTVAIECHSVVYLGAYGGN